MVAATENSVRMSSWTIRAIMNNEITFEGGLVISVLDMLFLNRKLLVKLSKEHKFYLLRALTEDDWGYIKNNVTKSQWDYLVNLTTSEEAALAACGM